MGVTFTDHSQFLIKSHSTLNANSCGHITFPWQQKQHHANLLCAHIHTAPHIWAEVRGPLYFERRRSDCISRTSFPQPSFWCSFIPPSSSQNAITLAIYVNFISHSITFQDAEQHWEGGWGGSEREKENAGGGWRVCLLGEIKCNFTVNLLWYIISQQWDVGWYNPSWHLYRAVRMSAMALRWCWWDKADVGGGAKWAQSTGKNE